jgi:hypothetical protein
VGERIRVAALVDERRLTFEDLSSAAREAEREGVDLWPRSRSSARFLAAETSVSGGVGGREAFLELDRWRPSLALDRRSSPAPATSVGSGVRGLEDLA